MPREAEVCSTNINELKYFKYQIHSYHAHALKDRADRHFDTEYKPMIPNPQSPKSARGMLDNTSNKNHISPSVPISRSTSVSKKLVFPPLPNPPPQKTPDMHYPPSFT